MYWVIPKNCYKYIRRWFQFYFIFHTHQITTTISWQWFTGVFIDVSITYSFKNDINTDVWARKQVHKYRLNMCQVEKKLIKKSLLSERLLLLFLKSCYSYLEIYSGLYIDTRKMHFWISKNVLKLFKILSVSASVIYKSNFHGSCSSTHATNLAE